jgi:hypothetical protein
MPFLTATGKSGGIMSQKTVERVLDRNGDLPAFKAWFLVTNLALHQTGHTVLATGFTRLA